MSEVHPDALRAGARVQEYRIERVLGRGGFGITYLAFDRNLNGPVALKEYFPADSAHRLQSGQVRPVSTGASRVFRWGLEKFLEEARATYRLQHPNVVRVYRYFEDRGAAYIVMEYVEGRSLAAILSRRGRLAPAEWRPLFEKLLAGLEHVHRHDYLHRDITPGNIVVRTSDGAPVLIDFGSARAATGNKTHTQVFTPEYAPLEQHGSGRQTPAADLYSLAAVSYRVLLGKLPPTAPQRVLDDTIERLDEAVESAAPGWLAALDDCLAIQPQDRPQSVSGFREKLRAPDATPNDPAVETYRERFEIPKSGRGMALVTPLSPPLEDWAVRRWVGRRSNGDIGATAFGPFHGVRGDAIGEQPLFGKRVNREAEGFAWLFELEESGALEAVAAARIPGFLASEDPSDEKGKASG